MAHAIQSAGLGQFITANVRKTVEDLKAAVEARKTYSNIVHELNSLSDRELDDLGVRRTEIPNIAHEHAYGA